MDAEPFRGGGGADARRKLSPPMVIEMLRLWKRGRVTMTGLAERFGVSIPTVHKIIRGKAWGWVVSPYPRDTAPATRPGPLIARYRAAAPSPETVRECKRLFRTENLPDTEIAARIGVSREQVAVILRWRRWGELRRRPT
jgi:DNA-binding CsgD family transcriptional regulator